jgi:hypothetical protein
VSLRDAILSGEFEAFSSALAPDVVWVGVEPGLLCRNREQVVETLRGWNNAGRSASPLEAVGL